MCINKEQITESVLEYIQRQNTNYAIMLNGDWGSGKTFYWDNELKNEIKVIDKNSTEKNYIPIYISLNGLNNTEQIARKIVACVAKDKTGLDVEFLEKHKDEAIGFFAAIKTIGNSLVSVVDMSNAFMKIGFKMENLIDYIDFSKIVICFDDLERFCGDINEIYGFINDFVEHKKTKVIILANENKIKASDYTETKPKEIKEKVIGKTIGFYIDKKEILTSIINSYEDEIKNFLISEIDLIVNVIQCNNSPNYRVIRSIFDDFRFISKAGNELDRNLFLKARSNILKYMLTVGLEIRVNGIDYTNKKCLRTISEFCYLQWEISNNKKTDKEKPPYHVTFTEKYYSSGLENKFLFESIFDYMDFGYLNKEKFRVELVRYKEKEWSSLDYIFNIGYWKMNNADFEEKIINELMDKIKNGELALVYYPKLITYFARFQKFGLLTITLSELENIFIMGMDKISKDEIADYNIDCDLIDVSDAEILKSYNTIHQYALKVKKSLLNVNNKKVSGDLISLLSEDIKKGIDFVNNYDKGIPKEPIFIGTNAKDVYNILRSSSNENIILFRNTLSNRYKYIKVSSEEFDEDFVFLGSLSRIISEKIPDGKLSLSDHLLNVTAESFRALYDRYHNNKIVE